MSAFTIGSKLHDAETEIKDPGASGTIIVDQSLSICNLVSAAAESRTLARPTRQGVIVTLHMKTDGGDITVTPTGGFTEAGTSTIVFANAGETATLISAYDGTDYFWRILARGGLAALTAAKPTFTIADAEGTPDNAIAAVTSSTPFGFSNPAELITILYKIQNMHTRLGEVEAVLKAAGITQ